MYISRLVIRNFRNFKHLDVKIRPKVTCVIGENNTGKTNLLHAIRLVLDTNLSSRYRTLLEDDIHSQTDLSIAGQVVISVEFKDWKDSIEECALVGTCEVEDNLARIHYRYRPRQEIRDKIAISEHDGANLSITEDYHYELTGGGDKDPATVEWNENLGSSLRMGDLQAFQVENLRALRDVQHSLRQTYDSPLGRILRAREISDEEKDSLVGILKDANEQIEAQETISQTGEAIKEAFAATAGEAFQMSLKLGMSDPSFSSIARSLKVLLTNDSLTDFEPARNGLGLNNILYISMLLDYFERRLGSTKAAGQLLLIEEPEAHLHPQLQRVLYATLAAKPFQAVITTHSTHISSQAPVQSFVTLTNDGSAATASCVPQDAANLTEREVGDLNRFLDATRSTLLYARKVMLVEGPAELFLIPVLVKQVMNIDLDRSGVTVVPIYGNHFEVYAKLFGDSALKKKCAIVTDGDAAPDELAPDSQEDSAVEDHGLESLENDYVKVFSCPVTFERALTIHGTLPMLLRALEECDYPEAVEQVREGIDKLENGSLDNEAESELIGSLREKVLNSAKRRGKARFAQIASKHIEVATQLPSYIRNAVDWLINS